jgi:hypothetical protein
VTEDDPTFREVVRGHSHRDAIAEHDADAEATELSGEVGVHFGASLGLDEEVTTWVHLHHYAFDFDEVV